MPENEQDVLPFTKEIQLNRGYLYERTEYDPLEKALADAWEQMCKDPWMGIETVCGRSVTDRERYVAASAIQWLGSNCGFSMLREAFSKAGYAIVGRPPSRPWTATVSEDPLLAAVENARNWQDFRNKLDLKAQEARQLVFDLSEPT